MSDVISVLKKNRLFENISEDVIENCVVPAGRLTAFLPRENIFMPLDRVDSVRVLLSGRVKLVYCRENGDEDIKNMLFPGSLVGADLICTRTRLSPYQAVATEKSEAFSFPAEVILKPGSLPEPERLVCLNNLLLILSQVNMQNEYRLAILTRNSLRERVMVYLTMQANKNRSRAFTVPFSREEMASFLRVNRSALSHELSLLKQEGIIDFSKNRFTLLKPTETAFESPEA